MKVSLPWGEARETILATPHARAANLVPVERINRPRNRAHHLGQVQNLFKSDIVDWAYWHGPVLQGGFSERLMLDRRWGRGSNRLHHPRRRDSPRLETPHPPRLGQPGQRPAVARRAPA